MKFWTLLRWCAAAFFVGLVWVAWLASDGSSTGPNAADDHVNKPKPAPTLIR